MTRIMVFGTFDPLHEGHLHFFRQARELVDDPYLIVSVGRDSVVTRIKGQLPQAHENTRYDAVLASGLAEEVVLGDEEGYMAHVSQAKPDIIALGYDQEGEFVTNLEADLRTAGLKTSVVRLRAHRPNEFKSSILKHRGI